MDEPHRKARLRHLIDTDYVDQQAFADKFKIPKGRVSQMAGPNHPFGQIAARRLEQKAGLPAGWFDQRWLTPIESKTSGQSMTAPSTPTAEIHTIQTTPQGIRPTLQTLAAWISGLDDTGRKMAAIPLAELALKPENSEVNIDHLARLLGEIKPEQTTRISKKG